MAQNNNGQGNPPFKMEQYPFTLPQQYPHSETNLYGEATTMGMYNKVNEYKKSLYRKEVGFDQAGYDEVTAQAETLTVNNPNQQYVKTWGTIPPHLNTKLQENRQGMVNSKNAAAAAFAANPVTAPAPPAPAPVAPVASAAANPPPATKSFVGMPPMSTTPSIKGPAPMAPYSPRVNPQGKNGASIYDLGSAVNLARAANNYMQPPPPIVRQSKITPTQVKINERPFQAMGENMVAQGKDIMRQVKDGSTSASSLLAAGNNVGANSVKAQNQMASTYSNAAQQAKTSNAQSQQQANQYNTQVDNTERFKNLEMQMQHAQMKKSAVDANINAAMVNQVQEKQYNLQKTYTQNQNEIQVRTAKYGEELSAYDQERNSNETLEYLGNERNKVSAAYNKDFGEGSADFKANTAKYEKEIAGKDIKDYGNDTDLAYYDKEMAVANALIDPIEKQKSLDAIDIKYREDIVSNKTMSNYRKGLSGYLGTHFDSKALLDTRLGVRPTLDFSDLPKYE